MSMYNRVTCIPKVDPLSGPKGVAKACMGKGEQWPHLERQGQQDTCSVVYNTDDDDDDDEAF